MPLSPPQSDRQRYHVRCVVVRPDLYGRTGWVEVVRNDPSIRGRARRHFVILDGDEPSQPARPVDICDLLLDPDELPAYLQAALP